MVQKPESIAVYALYCQPLSAIFGLGEGIGDQGLTIVCRKYPLTFNFVQIYMGTNILRPTCSEHMQSTNVHKYMQLYGLWNTKKVSASIFKWQVTSYRFGLSKWVRNSLKGLLSGPSPSHNTIRCPKQAQNSDQI